MSQFDLLIVFPLIFSLLITLVLYYNLSIKVVIPDFFGVKKFREKKLDSLSFYTFFNNNKSTNIIHSYKPIV